MAYIKEDIVWDDVVQLEDGDPFTGGPMGLANQQAKVLANRTQYLKEQIVSTSISESDEEKILQKAYQRIFEGDELVFPNGARLGIEV